MRRAVQSVTLLLDQPLYSILDKTRHIDCSVKTLILVVEKIMQILRVYLLSVERFPIGTDWVDQEPGLQWLKRTLLRLMESSMSSRSYWPTRPTSRAIIRYDAHITFSVCILQFKTNKKNVNDTRLPRCFSCLLVAVSHSSLIYIYISNLDIWCLIDGFAFLQWPRWEQAGVHQRHPALPVWGGHAFSPGKRSLGPPRSLSEYLHMFSQSSDFDL